MVKYYLGGRHTPPNNHREVKKLLVNSELIRQKRKERNLAQWQVGAVMGTDQRAISLIEKGKRRLKFEEAIRLARFFNLNVEDLIKE